MNSDDADTQQIDDVNPGSGEDTSRDAGQGGDGQDQYFLTVDDRTKYRTVEEAQKAYKEAGERISSLSGWEKTAKKYGITDPKHLEPLFNELLAAREAKKAGGSSQSKTGNAAQNANSQSTHSDADLSPEQKSALKWLKDNAKVAGYVPKEELEALAARVQQFEKRFTQTDDARTDALIDSGRNQLADLLKSEKLPYFDDGGKVTKLGMKIESLVRNYIEEEDERFQAFFRGGADLRDVVKAGFADAMEVINPLRQGSKTSQVTNKANSIRNNSKPLPQQGTGKGQNNATGQNQRQKPEGITPAMHDKAWATFQRRINGTSDSE